MPLVALGACGEARRDTTPPAAGRSAAPQEVRPTMPADDRAQVEEVLAATAITPGESLAVRLLGTVGPDGSWALDAIDVRPEADRVLVVPRVRRVAGDAFIQMVIPLDRTLHLALPAGTHRIEVQGRDSVRTTTVQVAANAKRPAVEVRVQMGTPADVGSDAMVPLRIEARVGDGFVDKIEVRETSGGTTTPWRAPDYTERAGPALAAMTTIRRAAGDPERQIEARAVDGQGTQGTSTIMLPKR